MTAAAATPYFANRGTISIVGTTASQPSSTTLAVIKNCTITPSVEITELYGWGTNVRQGVSRHTQKVTVKFKHMKFLATASGSSAWWPMFALCPGASPTGEFSDTNTVNLFEVTVLIQPELSSDLKLQAVIHNVYFKDFPINMTEGEYIDVDIEGTGSAITFTNPA